LVRHGPTGLEVGSIKADAWIKEEKSKKGILLIIFSFVGDFRYLCVVLNGYLSWKNVNFNKFITNIGNPSIMDIIIKIPKYLYTITNWNSISFRIFHFSNLFFE
jgi:hypothetical protein